MSFHSYIVAAGFHTRADAHRDDGKRFVVHTDEKVTAFMELESMIHARQRSLQ
jgi:hypothetical protein